MLQIRSKLVQMGRPTIMGILNVTPDSFACHCSGLDREMIQADCKRMMDEGVDIVDVGACSTRPGSEPVTEEVEWERLRAGLEAIRDRWPEQMVSVDTFRASIARRAIEEYGVDMINDVSGLEDEDMLEVLVRTRVPYILTHPSSACRLWTAETDVMSEVMQYLARQLDRLHRAGVADVVVDPGIGFGKSLEQNYVLLHGLRVLKHLQVPVMVGVSRKSMLYRPLGITPQEALNATTAAHVVALMGGADMLRVHDVREAIEAGVVVRGDR